MKYLILVIDGATDYPLDELEGRTPLQVARKPNLDWYAERGQIGTVNTVPEHLPIGSDVANMAIFGYDPARYYTGRGPIEAASMEIPVEEKDAIFRCNLIATDGEKLLDYSAGHISTEEARVLLQLLEEKLGGKRFHFYPGIQYRHIFVWREGPIDQKTTPPHDIQGEPIEPHLPEGEGDQILRQMMWNSLEILDNHEINRRRRDEGKLPANMIWLWGQGYMPHLPPFSLKTGLTGAVIAAVDLIKGIGRLAGLKVIEVPGATGYIDTNYEGKAQSALEALTTMDFAYIHVEAADEAGHAGDIEMKIEAIERIDRRLVGPLRMGLETFKEGYRLLILPDHATPIPLRTHDRGPVPFLLYDSTKTPSGPRLPFDERALEEAKLQIEEGHSLLNLLLKS